MPSQADTLERLGKLVATYAAAGQCPVRFREPTWRRALAAITGEPARLLTSDVFTTASTTLHYARLGDRLVTREQVVNACRDMNLDDANSVRSTYVLVMAWGSGTTDSRRVRYTAASLTDPAHAASSLAQSARQLRGIHSMDDPEFATAYKQLRLPGLGRSYLTKWFAFAGHCEDRDWQPLILDNRVLNTLERTLGVSPRRLSESRKWAQRYTAYNIMVHNWARELSRSGPPITPTRLEWILFQHNGSQTLNAAQGDPCQLPSPVQ